MRRFVRLLAQLGLAVLVASCGGGGGGGGGDGGNRTTAYALTFTPSPLRANFRTGTSATLTVQAVVGSQAVLNETQYIFIEDREGVLADDLNFSSVNATTVAATMHTSPDLPPGRHAGTIQVHTCRDSACASPLPGSPSPLNYEFTVGHAPLGAVPAQPATATAYLGGNVQRTVTVNVSATNTWTVTTPATWLRLAPTSGTANGSFTATFDQTGLAIGDYATVVRVASPDNQFVEIPFTLQVLQNQFTLTSGVPSFSMVNGTTLAAQNLGFALGDGAQAPWTAVTSASWLIATPLSGTTPSTVSLRPDPTRGPLASGSHSATLTLSSANVPDRAVTTQLTLIAPTLSGSVSSVTLGGTLGRDLTTPQNVALTLNTGDTAWPWQLSTLPAWLSSSATSGTINQTGTTLSFSANLAGVTPGSVSSTVNVRATVNGDTVTVPVTVNLNADQRRLLPSAWGVALATSPTGTVLTRTLSVADNFGANLAWTAASDRPWLTATTSGTTAAAGGTATPLVLVADASTLANGLHEASVTLSSNVAGVAPAVVRVGLWKDATGLTALRSLTQTQFTLAADPVRPFVYAHNGASTISVVNVYSTQTVGTIANVGGALGRMTVSPDGSRLYVLDTVNRALAVVDLATRTLIDTWALQDAVNAATPLIVIRPNGKEIVMIGNGGAYADGARLGTARIPGGALAATADGRRLYAHNAGLSPSSVSVYDVDHTAMAGGGLRFTVRSGNSFVNGSSNGKDVAVSPDGSLAIIASGAPYACSRVDPSSLSFIGSLPGGDAYPNNTEVTVDGRLICGASTIGPYDFWVHARNGALIQGYRVPNLRDRELVASGDGMVVIALGGGGTFVFVPIGAP